MHSHRKLAVTKDSWVNQCSSDGPLNTKQGDSFNDLTEAALEGRDHYPSMGPTP